MKKEKDLELLYLFDLYSDFLTVRQREIISSYYEYDFSLGEISQSLSITRQAVSDALNTAAKILYAFEEKLKLMQIKKLVAQALTLDGDALKKQINKISLLI